MIDALSYWVLPVSVTATVLFGLYKKLKVFDCFMEGAKRGLRTVYELLPSITGLVVAVTMLKASGALTILGDVFAPLVEAVGIHAHRRDVILESGPRVLCSGLI